MFKVVLVLKQITIRLREAALDVILRKNKEKVLLCSKAHLNNGLCIINAVKEFYVDIEDCLINLLLYFHIGNEKKYAGEVIINVFQWEENVIQATQSKITNCPDKNSRIKFQFYYFKDDKVIDNRPFFMSAERHKEQYNQIENSNKILSEEKVKLQEEVFSWSKKNQLLETTRKDMVDNMNLREIYHQSQRGNYVESINQYSSEFSRQKEKKEGLMKLAEEHGLDKSEWDKQS